MRWTRRIGALLGTGLLAALHFGCGGSDGGAGGSSDLTGLVNTDRFELPAGQTQQVTGDTTVHSTGDIVIDGDLQLAEGSSLALLADGALVITGNVVAQEPTATTRAGEVDAGRSLVFSGADVTIGPDSEAGPRTTVRPGSSVSIFIATKDEFGTVAFQRTEVEGGPGVDGQLPASQSPIGQAGFGGSVEIGTKVAENQVQAAGGESAGGRPAQVLVGPAAVIRGGRGGNGVDAEDPFVLSGAFEAGDGSLGGDVLLSAGVLTIGVDGDDREALVAGGRGGRGGDCLGEGLDGNPGETIRFRAGDGGDGGAVELDLDVEPLLQGSGRLQTGDGGRAGAVNLTAGNGLDGGNGGSVEGTVGLPGLAPEPSEGFVEQGAMGEVAFVVLKGGNGGDSPSADRPGGNGGFVDVSHRDGSRPESEGKLLIQDSFNSGRGFDGCGSDTPGPGSDGGTCQTLDQPGSDGATLVSLSEGTLTRIDLDNCFNGGDGGDGLPPGNGGRGGLDFLGRQVGSNGNNGSPCPSEGDGGDGGGGGGDQGGSVVEQEPNEDCATATPMGNATTGLGQGNGPNDVDSFKKEGLTIGKYRVTTTIAMNLDINAGQFQSLNFPVTENGFADISIRDLPGSICFRVNRITPDETYSFSIEKLSGDPDADVPPP